MLIRNDIIIFAKRRNTGIKVEGVSVLYKKEWMATKSEIWYKMSGGKAQKLSADVLIYSERKIQ